ncbi:hypothetical protein [Microlunatus speluncae]|uniref:hypothetical protein n=1 Tax=Microlunatus speluncae TaxID=2594267 RepID=UPI00126610B3|nr:hypothetical protein [Microlunatus speluncae]
MSHDPAGSPRPFDFGDEASSSAEPGGAAANPFVDAPIAGPDNRRFSWIALAIAIGMSLLVGLGGYARAAAYADGFDVDRGVRWVALTVLCVVGALAAVVVAVVAVVRARAARSTVSLIIAVIALVCALSLPWLALWLGTGLAPQPPPPA